MATLLSMLSAAVLFAAYWFVAEWLVRLWLMEPLMLLWAHALGSAVSLAAAAWLLVLAGRRLFRAQPSIWLGVLMWALLYIASQVVLLAPTLPLLAEQGWLEIDMRTVQILGLDYMPDNLFAIIFVYSVQTASGVLAAFWAARRPSAHLTSASSRTPSGTLVPKRSASAEAQRR